MSVAERGTFTGGTARITYCSYISATAQRCGGLAYSIPFQTLTRCSKAPAVAAASARSRKAAIILTSIVVISESYG